jgi:hypothetical protein
VAATQEQPAGGAAGRMIIDDVIVVVAPRYDLTEYQDQAAAHDMNNITQVN